MKERTSNISRTIVKAMGIFGGAQVISILCSIIRTKLVAVWIGPAGVGLFSLFNNAIDMLSAATSLGIRNSSVRDMAIARQSGKAKLVGTTIAVVKKWAWFTSIGGAVLTIALAPLLSRITFGTDNHSWEFVLLSVVLLFNGLTGGEQAILQGNSALKRLAKASVWGVVGGLLISIPMFYFWREESIVPSIVAYSTMVLLFTLLFRHKDYTPVKISAKEAYDKGIEFVHLGIYMTVSLFVTLLFAYIFSVYLNHTSGTKEVGFYQAGFTLVNKYVGLIFTAIGMEYYPRLSGIHNSRMRIHAFVSQEMNIAMLVLLPVVSLFLVMREWIVSILYSPEFHVVIPFISFAILGTVFRAYSWCLAFVILAKGDGKTYLLTELLSTVSGFILNIVFYHYWGLTGIGISYILWYFLYCIIVGIPYFRKYGFSVARGANRLTLFALVATSAVLVLMETRQTAIAVTLTALLTAACLYKVYQLIKK